MSPAIALDLLRLTRCPARQPRVIIRPAIAQSDEFERTYDSDEEPVEEDLAGQFERLFHVSVTSARSRQCAQHDATPAALLAEAAPDTTVATSDGHDVAQDTAPFVAIEEDCRRVLTAARVRREFLESAPRWTPTRSRGHHFDKPPRGAGADRSGRPPLASGQAGGSDVYDASRDEDEFLVGVGSAEEFLTEERRLIAVAAPALALGMEEAALRAEIRATWAARAHAAFCGLQSVVFFTAHRRQLEQALTHHAQALLLAYQRFSSLCALRLRNDFVLSVGRMMRGPQVRKLLQRQQLERDREAAKQRAAAAATARDADAAAEKRRVARKWQSDKAVLDTRASDSVIGAMIKTAKEAAATKDVPPTQAALHRYLADAALTPIVSAPGTMSHYRASIAEKYRCVSDDEHRSRAALNLESAQRFDKLVADASRVLPLDADAKLAIAARKAAEVAATNHERARVAVRIQQASIDGDVLQLQLRDARRLEALQVKIDLLTAEHAECVVIIDAEEETTRDSLMREAHMTYEIVRAHDERKAAMRQREWYLSELRRREAWARDLVARVAVGRVVRTRLAAIRPVREEVRALCGEQHRQAKLMVQYEVISWADVRQYFICTAPSPMTWLDPRRITVPSADCVPSVESLSRRSLENACAQGWQRLLSLHTSGMAEIRLMPAYLVGGRERAAAKLQAAWRGYAMRRHFIATLRDCLVLDRMKRVQRRMRLRSLNEREAYDRARLADAERDAFDALAPAQAADRLQRALREHCATLVQSLFRGYRFRRRALPRLQEDHWMRRYKSTSAAAPTRSDM
jgi:hypothetical protein